MAEIDTVFEKVMHIDSLYNDINTKDISLCLFLAYLYLTDTLRRVEYPFIVIKIGISNTPLKKCLNLQLSN